MKKYFEIGKINLLNNTIYAGEFFFRAIFILIILFIFINLWKVVYAGRELIEGFTISMMIWYLLMTESIYASTPSLVKEVNRDIQSGDIAYQLNKPYNYIYYHLFKSISYRILGFFVTFLMGAVLVYLIVGGFNFNFITIPFLLTIVIFAFILDFFIIMSISLLAFWFEDTNSFKWIYDKIIFTIGGMLVPLEIFPNWLASISEMLPFSFITYYPAKLFVDFNMLLFIRTIGMQLAYIVLFLAVSAIIYQIGIRRVNINGG